VIFTIFSELTHVPAFHLPHFLWTSKGTMKKMDVHQRGYR